VIDANSLALAHVYGQPPAAIAFLDQRLTDDEAKKIARLIVRLPELVPFRFKWPLSTFGHVLVLHADDRPRVGIDERGTANQADLTARS
jgi:hypothetical protein